ncbi:MAG: DEAD/DEAH box helicase [Kiritimatiellaeota bacterium]|nr:DEAD/DEAH box helicase [Kiritimatiellota bacterium]
MTVVLHSSWLDGALVVWGLPGTFARGRSAALPHVARERVQTFVAGVPTRHGEMVGGRLGNEAEDNAEMAETEVEGVSLDWRETFGLLQGLDENTRFGRGVFGGATFHRWREIFDFASALVARGRFLPGLLEAGGLYESRWIPAPDFTENARLEKLAERMPPAGACLRDHATHDAPRMAAIQFLEMCVDRLVRAACVTRLSRVHAEAGRFYSAHDAWVSSLRGDARVIRWDNEKDLRGLVESAAWWQKPALAGACAAAEWTFDLTAGDTPPDPGHPSCFFLAVRSEKTPDHDMLAALGQASRLCPFLKDAEAALTTLEAHQFLRVYAPMLEAAGFVVKTPEWWREKRLDIGVRAVMVEEGARGLESPGGQASFFSVENLVRVNWEAMIGGETVTAGELEALASSNEPLVWWRDQWVEVDRKAAREAARLLKRKTELLRGQDFTRLLLGVDEAAHGLRVVGVEANAWLQNVLKKMRNPEVKESGSPGVQIGQIQPSAASHQPFAGTLRPYQQRGVEWLLYLRRWGLGACLADDMGLGKTVQALAMLRHLFEAGQKDPVLLVCPMSVMTNWLREAARFTPGLRVLLHHGPRRAVGGSFTDAAKDAHMVVTSYHLLYRDYASLRRVKWGGLIYDEAQNLKNPVTRQSQAARALFAPTRVAMTGTPVENRAEDLWSLMDILNPGLLGSRKSFNEKFTRTADVSESREKLREIVRPFLLRRHKTDPGVADDLPAKREAKVFCRLTREQAALYRDVLAEFERGVGDAAGITRRGMIFGVLTRLKQVCNHPAQLLREEKLAGRSGKLARLEEMLGEMLEAGEAALVFTQYAEMGALLQRHIRETFGVDAPFLHGGSSRAERDKMVASFQSPDGPPVFVLSLRAGGTGLNLTRATQVFHYDRWWNPAVEDQATDRAFRIGQTRDVMVHKFIAAGTLEDHIDALIESKVALAEDLVGNGESWVASLDERKLADVLRLSK